MQHANRQITPLKSINASSDSLTLRHFTVLHDMSAARGQVKQSVSTRLDVVLRGRRALQLWPDFWKMDVGRPGRVLAAVMVGLWGGGRG